MKTVVTAVSQPSREDVLARLGDLLDGKLDREQFRLSKPVVRGRRRPGPGDAGNRFRRQEVLASIAGANLFGGNRSYLYNESYFAVGPPICERSKTAQHWRRSSPSHLKHTLQPRAFPASVWAR